MIRAEGLSKYYGSLKALNGLNFSIAKGEVVGFLGPNGAGKSTAMNILTGFLSLSEGSVDINGYDIFDEASQARASVGYLPEQPPLCPELTVTEYLHYVCGLKKLKRRVWKAELERILPMCSLDQVARRRIGHLSKGFRQRVGLAQALVGQPPLLILDEPTVGLDPQQILEIRGLISRLSGEHTILLSSHILSEIEAMCQRVLILNRGRLVADDSTAQLRQRLNVESCRLELELLGPAGTASRTADALARTLEQQGILEFSCTGQAVGSEQTLYRLEFELSGVGVSAAGVSETGENGDEVPFLAPRRELAGALAAMGFTIVAMVPHQRSLEDIFLNLTADSPAEQRKEMIQTKGVQA
ncbi:ABC transporter ATP-binding protein [Candidatus Haliotispira prima]|uniref:ABC transporter ATP-binding protein n=1 Tax=Candidatus Haliotispira prima TaxID=3034016 RepID=A0ABY8MHQ6_9SPIO|nr:ABC transporter ATP-binding protein [Candidatus Haliotispira prima]